ncbi:tRNA (guanine(46)-N(7))-methyltransferase TrmB [Fodinicurvata sp. EGI_FJ10296]|uniref:tRNA (guanine(46)-N(7))-methyltransferase TrmB n=1 Tax=Fodinicurvata sp. EGI_FJ10296 TaxID=3231908 RepID=UPI003452F9C7
MTGKVDSVPPNQPSSGMGGFHGRRVGRGLRDGQRALLQTLLPALAVPDEPNRTGALAPMDLFPPGVDEVGLEIGFGSGEHLLALLSASPHLAMIGCEPFTNGMASLLRQVEGTGIVNRLRLHGDDAGPVLRRLADASLSRVYLLFPDPWPKRRHAGRRFLQRETLDEMARLLADGGTLRMASDHPIMVDWMLRQARPHPSFTWEVSGVGDWRNRPEGWPPTRYEAKRLHGEPCYFTFTRHNRPSNQAPS